MRIAYLIITYKDPELAYRVSKKLTEGTAHHVFIHVDKKSDITLFLKLTEINDRVHLLKDRLAVYWGGYTMVEATILLMRTAYSLGGFDYYQIFYGADYPILSNDEIISYFNSHKNVEFIKAVCETDSANSNKNLAKYAFKWFFDKSKYPFSWKRIINKLNSIIVRRIPFKLSPKYVESQNGKMKIYRGWSHYCITDQAVKYILDFYNNNSSFNNFFRHVYAPDESYFHTILFNNDEIVGRSILGKPLEPSERSIANLLNLTFFEYPDQVRVFTKKEEYSILKDSGLLYFRKATSEDSQELLDYIDSL